MQGPRGPGLLMGIGRAKLVPPPVRKFAPSLKPQAPKVVAVVPPLEAAIAPIIASDSSADNQLVRDAPEQELASTEDSTKERRDDVLTTAIVRQQPTITLQKPGTANTSSVTRST